MENKTIYYSRDNSSSPSLPKREENDKKARMFFLFILPTLLYGIFFTFFLYRNFASITMIFYVLVSLCFSFYMLKKLGFQIKSDSLIYGGIMLLLAISSFLTANPLFITFNFILIFLLNIFLLVYNRYDTSKWHPRTYVISLLSAIGGMIGYSFSPFSDFSAYQKEKNKSRHKMAKQIILGFLIALPILVIILSLLASADPVFAQLVYKIFQLDWIIKNFFGIAITFFIGFLASYGLMRFLEKHEVKSDTDSLKRWNFTLMIPLLSLLSLAYIIFSCIQIFYLFLGKFSLPKNYTYAAYAREGFFQLLFVSFVNIALVLFVVWFFKEHISTKILLTVLSLSTYIMIASSAMRMILYIQNYNLTLLRIFVLWSLLVLALILSGILFYIYVESFPLFRYTLMISTFLFALLSLARPDYIIASYNLAHMEKLPADFDYTYYYNYPYKEDIEIYGDDYLDNYKDLPDDELYEYGENFDYSKYYADQFNNRLIEDYSYLENLSADAASVIAKTKQERLLYNYKKHIKTHLPPKGIRYVNLSFETARALLGIK